MSHRTIRNFDFDPLPSVEYNHNEFLRARRGYFGMLALTMVSLAAMFVGLILSKDNSLTGMMFVLLFPAIIVTSIATAEHKRGVEKMKRRREYVFDLFFAARDLPALIKASGFTVTIRGLDSNSRLLLTVTPEDEMYKRHEYQLTPSEIKVIDGPRLDSIMDDLIVLATETELREAENSIRSSFNYRSFEELALQKLKAVRLEGDG